MYDVDNKLCLELVHNLSCTLVACSVTPASDLQRPPKPPHQLGYVGYGVWDYILQEH